MRVHAVVRTLRGEREEKRKGRTVARRSIQIELLTTPTARKGERRGNGFLSVSRLIFDVFSRDKEQSGP